MKSGHLIAGRYRLRDQLGRGGMSVVWRATDDVLDREVAVKVLAPDLADDPALRRRIRGEARAAAGLRHAHVVEVYDYGEFTADGRTLSFVVMELVDGRSLADLLSGGRLPWKVAVLIGAQVAAALAEAHADGLVHRDVKPANVMVGGTGVKLVDFGISAVVGATDDEDGRLLGTPAYLAPERIAGGPVRAATDVYALGLLLYLALCGRMPWHASTVTQMVRAHVYTSPSALPVVLGLPPAVARLVMRCLAKEAADRPSAQEVAELLGKVAGLPSPALLRSAASASVPPPVRASRRRRTRGLLIASGVAASVLGAGGIWWPSGPPPPQAEAAAAAPVPSATPTRTPATSARTPAATVSSSAPRAKPVSAPHRRTAPAHTSPPEAAPKGGAARKVVLEPVAKKAKPEKAKPKKKPAAPGKAGPKAP
ncbi:serine/threonine-protein kinase [Actinoplanes sp. RD1]|uniref:serine/threonine-protein kinase n=1 Tax=Actinoplanes sp. RD1 TaxID=3064538 RepID=UPI002741A6BB|nr:serine/threonine-protein kinase [Actinoplanes sp. RD1]